VSIDPAAQLRHELRTPLNHIIGYTELLLDELKDGDVVDVSFILGETKEPKVSERVEVAL